MSENFIPSMLNFIAVTFLVVIAAIVQQFLPVIGSFYDARILLLPLVFVCAAVVFNAAGMLTLAYICGFLWDAQHALLPHPGSPEIYTDIPSTLPFGYSIVLYGAMGLLMQGIQPLFKEGKWHISALLTSLAIFLYLLLEFTIINFIRGDFIYPAPTMLKIVFTSFLTMLVSPLVYWLLFRIAHACNYTITYDGLKRESRYVVQ